MDGWKRESAGSAVAELGQQQTLERFDAKSPAPGGPAGWRAMEVVLWSALAIGVALRLVYFFAGRSLWIDEARVALNVASRSYAGLLRPLDYDQSAPPLFLWGEKLASQLLGVNDRTFWLLPLFAGIAAMVLFIPLARRFLPGWVGVLAAASFCIAPTLVHYSAVAKPYIGDLTLTLAITVAAYEWVERPSSMLARALPWLGVVAAWASSPSIFTLVGAGGAIVLGSPPDRRRKAVAMGGLWLAAFGAAYLVSYRLTADSHYLHDFWLTRFLTPGPRFIDGLAGSRREVLTAFSAGLYYPATAGLVAPGWFVEGQRYGTWLLAVVIVVGIVALVRTRARWEAILLFGPLLLLGAASGAGQYPISSRLVLFVVPAIYLGTAAGIAWLLERLPPTSSRLAGRSVVALLFGAELLMMGRYLAHSASVENVRDLVAVLDRARGGPQTVYVGAGALPAWAFYTTNWARPDSARLARYAALGASDGPAFENAASRGRVAPGEGWDFRLNEGRRTVLLGVPAGVWRRPKIPDLGPVDQGWVENETGRIIRATGCRNDVWVLGSHTERPDTLLLEGLSAAGGRVTFQSMGRSSGLTRFDFGGHCSPQAQQQLRQQLRTTEAQKHKE